MTCASLSLFGKAEVANERFINFASGIPCMDKVVDSVVRITQLSTVPTILSLCEVNIIWRIP